MEKNMIALEKIQTEDAEDHTVIDDFQRGYKFKGKLLRPSMVKVFRGSSLQPPERLENAMCRQVNWSLRACR